MNCFNWENQDQMNAICQPWRSIKILIAAAALLMLTGSAQAGFVPLKLEPYSCQRLHNLEHQCGGRYCDAQWLSDVRVECWQDQRSQQELFNEVIK
jgi:hypothetical protein